MISSLPPHSETPLLGPRSLPCPATHLDAAPCAPALPPIPNTHTPPLLGPTTRSQKESDSSSQSDRAQGTRPSPCWGNTDRQAAPQRTQRTSEGGSSRLTETQMARRQSNALGARGQGKAGGPSPHPLANLRQTVPRAGPGGDGDKGLACPLGKDVTWTASGDSGLADRRHSHLPFRFWVDV